jgi:hypothetical protein
MGESKRQLQRKKKERERFFIFIRPTILISTSNFAHKEKEIERSGVEDGMERRREIGREGRKEETGGENSIGAEVNGCFFL